MSLEANNLLYELLLAEIGRLQRQDSANLLSFAEETATRANCAHPGRFADGALENIFFEAGLNLNGDGKCKAKENYHPRGEVSRTLHVATEVLPTGGHSRLLTKWIQRDLNSSPGIVLTRQQKPVPDFLRRIWRERNTKVTELNVADSICERALKLRALSSGYDRVILHHYADDPVPIVAYAKAGGCPVAMMNHAHFSFCLGSSVSDIIINTHPYFQSLTRRHRFPKETAVLVGPFGLETLEWEKIDKEAAKKDVGLPMNCPVGLAMGQEHYFKPKDGYDFFKTSEKLLERQPNLHLVIVGVHSNCSFVSKALKQHERFHLIGAVTDPNPYYKAADISLESFPMPSFGAFIESVAYGEAFPVLTYGVGENILRINLHPLPEYPTRAKDEEEYLNAIDGVLTLMDSARKKAAEIRRSIISADKTFSERLHTLNVQIDGLKHHPGKISATSCCHEEDNRLLASVSDPDIGRQLSSMLPLIPSVKGHIQAGFCGYETPRLCLARIKNKILGTFEKMISN